MTNPVNVRPCSDCGRTRRMHAAGLCKTCYERHRRNGTLDGYVSQELEGHIDTRYEYDGRTVALKGRRYVQGIFATRQDDGICDTVVVDRLVHGVPVIASQRELAAAVFRLATAGRLSDDEIAVRLGHTGTAKQRRNWVQQIRERHGIDPAFAKGSGDWPRTALSVVA